MDIVEFAEWVTGDKLREWQKDYLESLAKLPDSKIRIATTRDNMLYIYPDKQTLKELTRNYVSIKEKGCT